MRRISLCFVLAVSCLVSCSGVIANQDMITTPTVEDHVTSTFVETEIGDSVPLPSTSIETPTLLPTSTPLLPTPSPAKLPSIASSAPGEMLFSDYKMFDLQSGWAVINQVTSSGSTERKVIRTTSGLSSWRDDSPPISVGYGISATFFLDINTALVLSRKIPTEQTVEIELVPWRTEDGGLTWQAGRTINTDRPSMGYIEGIDFIDPTHGWMLTSEEGSMGSSGLRFFYTDDGGLSWKQIYATADSLGGENSIFVSWSYPFQPLFNFIRPDLGFFPNHISRDGGNTWADWVMDPPPDLPELTCTSGNPPCKYISYSSVPVFTTPQDGTLIRWIYQYYDEVSGKIVFLDNPDVTPVPIYQYFYYTHDGGNTWTPLQGPPVFGTYVFLDVNIGWVLGNSTLDQSITTQLYQTTDSGNTWEKIAEGISLPPISMISFLDDQNGFATGPAVYSDEGLSYPLYLTHDGGRTWEPAEISMEE